MISCSATSNEDIFWEEKLIIQDISDAELEARFRQYSDIAKRAEFELDRLLDAAVFAGKLTAPQATDKRAAFQDRMLTADRQLEALVERSRTIVKGPTEPN